jgi:hypothetical protein
VAQLSLGWGTVVGSGVKEGGKRWAANEDARLATACTTRAAMVDLHDNGRPTPTRERVQYLYGRWSGSGTCFCLMSRPHPYVAVGFLGKPALRQLAFNPRSNCNLLSIL